MDNLNGKKHLSIISHRTSWVVVVIKKCSIDRIIANHFELKQDEGDK
ncbi:hypothetical protein [Shewanella sp. 10N.286.51.B7]|nr:hypothetical protein [Shewanella sp. 10N.286.51.B7]